MEFKFEQEGKLKYNVKIATKNYEGELKMTYEQLREIHQTIKSLNPTASSLFPRYKLWNPLRKESLDLVRFEQWSEAIFNPSQYSQYPQDIKDYLSNAFGIDFELLIAIENEKINENDENGEEKESGGRSTTKTALKVMREIGTEVVIPVLLSVAEEVPIIGRIAGLLSKVGNVLKEFNIQDSLVQDLRKEISKVEESLKVYKEISEFNDAEMKKMLPLQVLEESLGDALKTLLELSSQGSVLGVVFSKKDNDKIRKHIDDLSTTLQSFCVSIPLYQQRLVHRQKINALLRYPEVFHSTILQHLSQFQPDSRQWLFEECDGWLKDENEDKDEESGIGEGEYKSHGQDQDAVDGIEMKGDEDSKTQISPHHTTKITEAKSKPPNRMFWIRADPGMGKSAFVATLSKKLKEQNLLLGAYFCRYTEKNESPSKIIRSLAAQCCENLSSLPSSSLARNVFEKAFVEWDRLPESEKPSSLDLFDLLLSNPLQEYSKQQQQQQMTNPPHNHPPMVILIDALDEVLSSERKPLLNILSSKIQDLPSWVKFVVTSRPEPDIVHSFKRLNPVEIKEDDPRHLEDIRLFVRSKLRGVMSEDELERGVDLFVGRSEGRFIYVSSVLDEMTKNRLSRWSLSDLDDRLPEGLVGWYREFFVRMRSRDENYFDEVIMKVVGLIIGAKEPLSLMDVKLILGFTLSKSDELRLVDDLHRLFPLRIVSNSNSSQNPSEVFIPFHKSVFDWLTTEELSGGYWQGEVKDNFFVDVKEINKTLATQFQSLFTPEWIDVGNNSCRPISGSYFYRHAFDHFHESGSVDDVLFGLNQLFRLRVTGSLLEEIGVHELLGILRRYLTSLSSLSLSSPSSSRIKTSVQVPSTYIIELKLLFQLIQLSSPGLVSRDVDALPFQLLARLTPSQLDGSFPLLKQLSIECKGWRSSSEKGYWLKPSRNYLTPAGSSLEKIIKLKETPLCMLELPNGLKIVGCGNCLLVLNSNDEIELELIGHTERVTSVCALSDGRVVSGSEDKTLRVWNVSSGSCELELKGHTWLVTSVCALSDGRVVSGSKDKTLRVWNVSSGSCELELKGHTERVTSVCALSDGRVVSGSNDKTLRVWNVSSGSCELELKGHTWLVSSVCALSDGRVVSGSWDKTLRVWNVSSGSCEFKLKGHTGRVTSVCALSDGRVVSGSWDKTLRVWNVSSGSCELELKGHTGRVSSVCALSDGRVVSGSWDNTLRVWDVSTGVEVDPANPYSVIPFLDGFASSLFVDLPFCQVIARSHDIVINHKIGDNISIPESSRPMTSRRSVCSLS